MLFLSTNTSHFTLILPRDRANRALADVLQVRVSVDLTLVVSNLGLGNRALGILWCALGAGVVGWEDCRCGTYVEKQDKVNIFYPSFNTAHPTGSTAYSPVSSGGLEGR